MMTNRWSERVWQAAQAAYEKRVEIIRIRLGATRDADSILWPNIDQADRDLWYDTIVAAFAIPKRLPTCEELFPKGMRRPYTTKLLYEGLQRLSGGATLDQLRAAAWPDEKVRRSKNEGTIHILMKRLDYRLARHGITIARIGWEYEERYYKLVGV